MRRKTIPDKGGSFALHARTRFSATSSEDLLCVSVQHTHDYNVVGIDRPVPVVSAKGSSHVSPWTKCAGLCVIGENASEDCIDALYNSAVIAGYVELLRYGQCRFVLSIW